VVDAGGPLTWWTGKTYDVTGKFYLVKLDALNEQPDGPSPAEYLAQQHAQADQRAAQAQARLAAVEADEVKSGRCEASRAAKMQNVAIGLGRLATEGLSGGTDSFALVDKAIVVATPDGATVPLDAKTGGTEHVFVVAFEPTKLDLKDGSGYAVTAPSPYATVVRSATGGQVDSRTVQANVGEHLQAKVTGKGCVLVAVMRQL
jgi:hypothetical protein